MRVVVSRATDPEVVRMVGTLPGIWEATAEDGFTPEEYNPDVFTDCWLTLIEAESSLFLGVCLFKVKNSATLEIHPKILPDQRKRYHREAIKAALRWIVLYAPVNYQKIVAETPEMYKHLVWFALSMGFTREGSLKQAFWKNGKLVDLALLGISREKLESRV